VIDKLDFIFRGKWLVRYEPGEFTYPEILILLTRLHIQLERLGTNFRSLNFILNKKIKKNTYFRHGKDLFLQGNGQATELSETGQESFAPAALEPLAKPIRSVNLLFPRLDSDPRWKTMGLPAAQLFIASSLQASGFQATTMPLILPTTTPPAGALEADLTGFTIFEDLLPALRPFLARFQAVYGGWLAAGGPFPTLAPLAALYHLSQVNLFVRGEAEQALPKIFKALNRGDVEELFRQPGFAWQQPGLIVISDFDRINRPETFSRFQVNFDFLQAQHLEHGLEMNFSRGCGRGCFFCCRVQGSKFRELPLNKASEFLRKYGEKIAEFELNGDQVNTVNINDDDILQNLDYAGGIFNLIKKNGFRIIGIQTSAASLVKSGESVNGAVLDLAADTELFVDNRPLLWLGSDTFLPERGRRLGKRLPSPEAFVNLLGELEKRGIRHFHYWISSDDQSNWNELVDEFALICKFYRDFPNFALLAHAPFIVPYPASRLFQFLSANAPNLRIKEVLRAPDPLFNYVLPEYLETAWPNLNRLLNNEKAGGDGGFFDFLKAKDFKASAQLAYHFLKQEELQSTVNDQNLGRARIKLEEVIGKLLELTDR
jgi:hypothetical protein